MKNNRRQLGTREPSRPSTGVCGAPHAAAEQGVTAARTLLVLIAIFVCAQPTAWAGDGNDGTVVVLAATEAAVVAGALPDDMPVEPFIHPSLAPEIRANLETALEIAAERVREIEACGDLFTQLGADGLDMLNTGLYLQADSLQGRVRICGRDGAASSWGGKTLAYTQVGAASTWICRRFARVPADIAAVAVIHEALHHAGLTEWPADRTAMTSEQITRMVKKACEF